MIDITMQKLYLITDLITSLKRYCKNRWHCKNNRYKNATSATKNLNLVAEIGVNTIVTNDKLNDTIEPQITLNEQLQAPIKKIQ